MSEVATMPRRRLGKTGWSVSALFDREGTCATLAIGVIIRSPLAKGERIRFLERPERPLAQAALQFVLANPAVSVAILGATKPEQARANAAAAAGTLSPEEMQRLEELDMEWWGR